MIIYFVIDIKDLGREFKSLHWVSYRDIKTRQKVIYLSLN